MKPVVQKLRKNVSKNSVFSLGPNMCYVNYNIPRTLPMNQYQVKKLIKDGNLQTLEEKLLNGEGYKLIGHYSVNPKIKTFLQSVPIYIARIDMLQDSACRGNLRDMQVLLENGNSSRNIYKITPTKLVCSKDLNGVTVLHKAVYYDFLDIVEWLVKNYPQTVHMKDKTLRIPLHYICSCSEVPRIWDLMLEAGADPNALDINNKTPAYYLECSENITLPNNSKNDCSDQEVSIKPSNIRIWIHERNIKQLAKVIWCGFGDKLLTETSKQSTVHKFLKSVPHIMGIIKEIHKAVIEDNLTLLKKLNRDPVPEEILASKDMNGLNPLHKAVGLGRLDIVDYILSKNSKTVNTRDNDGRTPLHYVFVAPQQYITPIYNRLIKAGANENLIDKNGKTPKGDGGKTNDIPMHLLTVLPKAPRTASEFPASWDWNIFNENVDKDKADNKSKLRNIPVQDSEVKSLPVTSKVMANTQSDADIDNTQNIDNIENVDSVENASNVESANNVENVDDIENVQKNGNKETNDLETINKDYISLFIKSEQDDSSNNIDNNENKENYDHPRNGDTNYTSFHTESKSYDEDDDVNDFVGKNGNKELNDFENTNKDYISLYTKPGQHEFSNNINSYENKENNDPRNGDTNYTSYYTQSKSHDVAGVNGFASKPDSFTLGEVRRALNNGMLDDILPMGGPVYRVNSTKETKNIEVSDDNAFDSNDTQERNSSARIIVKKGDLNTIADYILDGKHEKILGMKSDIPEVQDFLDKIPFYANKIDQIHCCCAVGDLDGLTQVLDRRKFSKAREFKSGLGLTPLHTAAVHEQLDIFLYLAAKFPETLKLNDFRGWTPMNYVTCMPDKTFLEMILNSDGNVEEFRTDYHMPENFRNNEQFEPEKIRKALGYTSGVEKISDIDMDRSSTANSSGKLLSTVMSASRFSVEDREYLTKAIGKPLTSGLKELIKRRPSNPTLYLAEHLTNHFDDPQSDQESGVLHSRGRLHSLSADGQSIGEEIVSKPWDIFSNYHPEFKIISRDEFGMSMIHYAASRTHNRNAFFQLLQELDANIGLRDENYRTPRDIAVSSNIRENVKTIDKYVVHIIARGEYNKVINLLLEGYSNILDLDTDKDVLALSSSRGHSHISIILQSIPSFEEKRERLHRAIRSRALSQVAEILQERDDESVMLAMAKNERSRCSLHIAVLSQNEEIVRFLAENFPTTLDVFDNIERTALHYAMSVDQVEVMSTILIGCGAKRIAKDLKGRQPSYYFMNKFDIRKLREEENESWM